MASENETVAEIVGEMRGIKKRVHLNGGRAYENFRIRCEVADECADRIEVAHRREVESYKRLLMTSQCALEDEIVKNQNLKREVAELKKKCEEYERQPELMAETAKAALELLKSQDAKIAELRECLKEAITKYCTSRPHEYDDGFGNCENFKNGACAGSECWRLECVNKWRKALEGVSK